MSQKPIPRQFLNEQDSHNLASWNIPKNILALHDDPSLVPKPLSNPPSTLHNYKSWTAEVEEEEEQAAKEVEQEEPAEDEALMQKEESEPVDGENMQIAEVTTATAEVSIEKKADSIAASEDDEEQAAAGQEEDGGEESPVKKPKVVFFLIMIQFKLKANTFSGAI